MSPRAARRSALALALLAAMAGAYALYWRAAAQGAARGIADWAAAARGRGIVLEYRAIDVASFPFALAMTLAEPRLTLTRGDARWRFSTARITARARPWNPRRIAAALPAETAIRRATPAGEAAARLRIADGRAEIEIGADGALEARFTTGTATLEWAGDALAAARLAGVGGMGADGRLTFALDARSVSLPAALDGPLGRKLSRLALDAASPSPAPAGFDAAALDAWRTAGGRLDIAKLSFRWGDFAFDARGVLTLDAALRPEGRLDAEVAGWRPAIGAFVAAGRIDARDGALAAAFLDLMARPGKDGRRMIAAPLVARKGRVYLGPIALARFGSVVEPEDE